MWCMHLEDFLSYGNEDLEGSHGPTESCSLETQIASVYINHAYGRSAVSILSAPTRFYQVRQNFVAPAFDSIATWSIKCAGGQSLWDVPKRVDTPGTFINANYGQY